MQTQPTNMPVADYCQAMERNEIRVNREYQRSEKVWPPAARSFLIETILLGFPMPKLAHHQTTDLKTRKVTKEIVDGQQRSMAILEFWQNKYRLSKTVETDEIKGKKYKDLEPEYQQQFLDYSLSIDLFVGATAEEIREVFRRINSYTVPLNPEEQRHAEYQGKFKWFIHGLARKLSEGLKASGIFAEKQLIRMQDTKLLADIVFAMEKGIQTTKSDELDELYKEYEEEFTDEEKVEKQLMGAFDLVLGWNDLHNTQLMKPHNVFALLLALIHIRTPLAKLTPLYKSPSMKAYDPDVVVPRLTQIAELLELEPDDAPKKHKPFLEASSEKTNVKETREIRFKTYCAALDAGKK